MNFIDVSADTVLFQEGETGDCAYLVESGCVEVSIRNGNKSLFLGTVMPGELIGEMSIIDNQPRSATAVVREDTRLLVIRRDQFQDRMDQIDPTLRYVFQLLALRLRDNLTNVRNTGKQYDRNSQHIDKNLKESAISKLRLEADLWAAIDEHQLSVYYQPIIDLSSQTLAGFEALLRWDHPEHGQITPGVFIRLAEETPLIEGIGELVVKRVAEDLPQIQQLVSERHLEKPESIYVSVNVSARQIDSIQRFQNIYSIVNKANLDPYSIALEITETQLVDTIPVMSWVREVKKHGFKVAIDDFGRGYSSLSHLMHLGADTLKIDRAFVRDLLQHRQAESMVRAIISIAQAFNMNIVAEGIETESQKIFLAELGCHYGQGFLLGHPMSFSQLEVWIKDYPVNNITHLVANK